MTFESPEKVQIFKTGTLSKKVNILKLESLLKQLSRNNLSRTNCEVADPKPFQLETYAKAR